MSYEFDDELEGSEESSDTQDIDLDLGLDDLDIDQDDSDYEALNAAPLAHEPAKVINPNHIELPVIAVAGQITLSLQQLLELKIGDALDVGELPATVKLLANNVLIAYGYLVEFNGRLGVKISKLVNNQEHAEV